jgi:DNA-binding NarL/FixJ family response regulator
MVTIPPLFADIIRQALGGHVAIEIVAEIGRRNRLEERLRGLQPDLVLIGLRRGEADTVGLSILAALPRAKVIAFSSDARSAYVHEVRPHRIELQDFSMEALFTLLSLLPTWLAEPS